MTLRPGVYKRKPTFVKAMRVVPDALNDIAEWCKGEPITLQDSSGVMMPYLGDRHFVPVGDWIVLVGENEFLHYQNESFIHSYLFDGF